jgi:TetR/AcrR family transcriptional regulator, cholesterol catabolism regulator
LLRISIKDRKDFIAEVSTRVFSEKGYQLCSIQDIAFKAELSKAGIYHYFKSKEEILSYILLENTDIFLDKLKRTIKKNEEKALSSIDSFKILMRVYAYQINKDNDKRQIVLRERHQLSGEKKIELINRERAIFRLLRNELRKIKDLDEEINLNLVTFMIISISHWIGYWFKEGKEMNINEIIDQNLFIILRGIRKPTTNEVRCKPRNDSSEIDNGDQSANKKLKSCRAYCANDSINETSPDIIFYK